MQNARQSGAESAVEVSRNLELGGRCDSRFTGVEKRFLENFATAVPSEVGAALAVYLDGELVIDLHAGWRNAAHRLPWQRHTPVCVFSCTKGVVSILAMRLVQRGLLDYDAPVADYWPEFGCQGKEQTTVAQLLSHQAGLPVLKAEFAPGGIWQWEAVCSALASSKPRWTPGERHGYHALTWGYLVGALLERASGAPLDELLQQEISRELGLGFTFGLQEGGEDAVAELCGDDAVPVDPAALGTMTRLDDATLLTPTGANSRYWRNSLIPGANGHGSALDLATLYQQLLPGGHFLDREIVAAAKTVQAAGRDAVLGVESAYAMGFQVATADLSPGLTSRSGCWGHRGMYGATGFVDEAKGLAVGYVMNYCGDPQADERSRLLLESLYASIPVAV